MSQYWYLAFVYFNRVKSPVDFRLTNGTSLDVLKSKLDYLLHHTENRKVVKIEYYSPSIDNEGNIRFSKFELKIDEDLKDPIEVDAAHVTRFE